MYEGCNGWTHIARVRGIAHNFEPAFESSDLEEREVGPADMVELHLAVEPAGVVLSQASLHIWHNLGVHRQTRHNVKALGQHSHKVHFRTKLPILVVNFATLTTNCVDDASRN